MIVHERFTPPDKRFAPPPMPYFKKSWALTNTLATPLNTRAIALHRPCAQWVSGYVISFHPCPGARVFSTQSGTGDMRVLYPLPSLMPGPKIRRPCAPL